MQEYGHITPQQRLIIRISRNSLMFASINNEGEGAISFYPYVLKSGISMAANLREAFRTPTGSLPTCLPRPREG